MVTVKHVSPEVSLAAPGSGAVGSTVSFLASATSPNPADQKAGFTYSWNFGDGGTTSGASPSHTYAAAGTYSVSVTATDKDGGVSTPATSLITISPAAGIERQRGQQFQHQRGE